MPVCELCESRRARRACPGIRGQICSVCCGAEREVSIHCPLDCDYLREARRWERTPEPDPEKLPSADIPVSDEFVEGHGRLIALAAHSLMRAALEMPGAVDSDVRDALDSLVRTYRTLESGLYYETLPTNPLAGGIHSAVRRTLEETRQQVRERSGTTPYRDADVLGALVYLQRLHYLYDNGRRRGRAFIDFLRNHLTASAGEAAGPSSLIVG